MWDDLRRSKPLRKGEFLLFLVALLLLVPAASSGSVTGSGALVAQEPQSVEEMDESPALQQLPSDETAPSDSLGARNDQPVPLHPEAEEAIARLRSPWCPGFMLEVCPSPQAAELRDTLRMMAQEGIGADSLVEWTLARYGEEWRALPEARGTGLLAWLIPPAMLILGAGIVVVVLRRLRKGSEGYRPGEAPELSEEDERRLQEALDELEWEGR